MPAEDIEVVADLVEQVGAAPGRLAPPVARQVAAVLGRQVLGGVDGDDLAQLAGVHAGDHLAHDRHGAHDQADEQRRRRRRPPAGAASARLSAWVRTIGFSAKTG